MEYKLGVDIDDSLEHVKARMRQEVTVQTYIQKMAGDIDFLAKFDKDRPRFDNYDYYIEDEEDGPF